MLKSRSYYSCETLKINEIALQAGVTEDMEQRRRLLDKEGEAQRKWVANKIAQIFKFTPYQLRHVPWPLQASLFLRKPAHGVLEDSVHAVEEAFHSVSLFAEEAYTKTAEALIAFGHKTVDFASSVTEKTAEAASLVGEKTVEAANVVGDKTVQAYCILGDKTAEARLKAKDTALLIKHKTYEAAALFGHKTADIASVVGPLAVDIAAEAKSRLVHLTDEIVYSTTRSYVKALMEFERRRRMTDFDEQYAILNALACSSIIKGLGYEFYRQSNCTFTYSFILLEESERKWRQMPVVQAVAFANAKKVSLLIKGKFFPIAEGAKAAPVPSAPATKLEQSKQAETPLRSQTAYTPAL